MDEYLIRPSDAIKAVIEAMDKHCNGYNSFRDRRIRNAIEGVPSTDRWIPCSERLPEDWEKVLVCTTAPYTIPIFVDWYVDEIGSWANEGDSVIAWMPLPQPYKGADDEAN